MRSYYQSNIHHHHWRSAVGQVLSTWFLSSLFSSVSSLTGCCMGPRRDTVDVYRPWYSSRLLPIKGAHGTDLERSFTFRAILSLRFIFLTWSPRPSPVV